MRVVKNPSKLNLHVTDLDKVINGASYTSGVGCGYNDSGCLKRHGDLLPNYIRAIFAGPSSCGKTNVMLTLLTNPNGLRYECIYLYSKSLYQPKYQFLREVLRRVPEIHYYEFTDNSEILDPKDAMKNSIFIFDDVACDPQDKIRAYFSMGRHKAVDCFYLCQTYTRIPKHLLRDNANMLVLFKQDEVNLKHIHGEHVTTDMTFEMFKELCAACWNDCNCGFLVIMKDFDVNKGRYRKGFDNYIYISDA